MRAEDLGKIRNGKDYLLDSPESKIFKLTSVSAPDVKFDVAAIIATFRESVNVNDKLTWHIFENEHGELLKFAGFERTPLAVGKKYCVSLELAKNEKGSWTQYLFFRDLKCYTPPVQVQPKDEEKIINRDEWLTTQEAAHALGIKPQTVQVYMTRGKFPHAKKFKGAYLIPPQDIEAYKTHKAEKEKELAKKRREPREPRSVVAKREFARQAIKNYLIELLANKNNPQETLETISKAIATLEKF